jgi:hypothetical protein
MYLHGARSAFEPELPIHIITLLPEMPVTEPKTRFLPEAKLDINTGCSVLNIFNIPTECTSLFLTHVCITSVLHVLVCYVHHLQGEPLIISTKASAFYCFHNMQ